MASQTVGHRLAGLGVRLRCESVVSRKRPAVEAVVGDEWIPRDEASFHTLGAHRAGICCSRRSSLPAGSEVHRVGRHDFRHGPNYRAPQLVPVPVVSIGCELATRSSSRWSGRYRPTTRAILVAHLFGTHIEMGPIHRLAKQFDLLVIEDCAQAFVGR